MPADEYCVQPVRRRGRPKTLRRHAAPPQPQQQTAADATTRSRRTAALRPTTTGVATVAMTSAVGFRRHAATVQVLSRKVREPEKSGNPRRSDAGKVRTRDAKTNYLPAVPVDYVTAADDVVVLRGIGTVETFLTTTGGPSGRRALFVIRHGSLLSSRR